ncbi:MAG: relaxase domain-containing protein, partial [Pseudomonadota bacterium]
MVASISAVSSAAAAKSYYGKDNYYAKSSDRPEPSAWFGKGADRLALKGEVDLETFENVRSTPGRCGRSIACSSVSPG